MQDCVWTAARAQSGAASSAQRAGATAKCARELATNPRTCQADNAAAANSQAWRFARERVGCCRRTLLLRQQLVYPASEQVDLGVDLTPQFAHVLSDGGNL